MVCSYIVLRQALEQLLVSQGFQVSEEHLADIVIVDLTRNVELIAPPTPLPSLALVREGEDVAVAVLRLNYKGYLGPKSEAGDLQAAIRAIKKGEIWAGRRVVAKALDQNYQMVATSRSTRIVLTPRERKVVALLLKGLSNSEVGNQLDIAEKTVKGYVSSIYAKCGVKNRRYLELFFQDRLTELQDD